VLVVVLFQVWIEYCWWISLSGILLVCLHAGLPVQVRDKALKIHDEIPKSDVGKEYYQQNLEREVRGFTLLQYCDTETV